MWPGVTAWPHLTAAGSRADGWSTECHERLPMRHIPLLIATLAALPGAASAQVLDEARFGVTAHNTCVLYCDNSNKEDGPNLNGEIVLNSPDFLDLVWSPRPYAMASLNTAGDTSFAGQGSTGTGILPAAGRLSRGLAMSSMTGSWIFPSRRATRAMILSRRRPCSLDRATSSGRALRLTGTFPARGAFSCSSSTTAMARFSAMDATRALIILASG